MAAIIEALPENEFRVTVSDRAPFIFSFDTLASGLVKVTFSDIADPTTAPGGPEAVNAASTVRRLLAERGVDDKAADEVVAEFVRLGVFAAV